MVTNTDTSPANPRTVVYSYGYDKDRVTSFTLDCQGDTVGTRWTITAGYEYDKDGNLSRISPVGREMLVATEMTSPIAFQRRLVERLITTQSTERIENEKVCSIYPY